MDERILCPTCGDLRVSVRRFVRAQKFGPLLEPIYGAQCTIVARVRRSPSSSVHDDSSESVPPALSCRHEERRDGHDGKRRTRLKEIARITCSASRGTSRAHGRSAAFKTTRRKGGDAQRIASASKEITVHAYQLTRFRTEPLRSVLFQSQADRSGGGGPEPDGAQAGRQLRRSVRSVGDVSSCARRAGWTTRPRWRDVQGRRQPQQVGVIGRRDAYGRAPGRPEGIHPQRDSRTHARPVHDWLPNGWAR